MSTSQARRDRREYERMKKMPTWKVIKKFKDKVGDVKLKSDMVIDDSAYLDFINNVEITPEMKKELEEYDRNNKKMEIKPNSSFPFEVVK